MPSLQEHMLRVAAVAYLVCENFDEVLPRQEIVTACLLHDMGNIIKFNLNAFPEFLEPEGLEHWQKVKDEYVRKYGADEYLATKLIAEEMGVSGGIGMFLENLGFSKAAEVEQSGSFAEKITNYSDMRVSPHGVVSMGERIQEGRKRYLARIKELNHAIATDNFEPLCESLRNIEKQIFAKCKIKPEDINDETVKPIIEELRDFVI